MTVRFTVGRGAKAQRFVRAPKGTPAWRAQRAGFAHAVGVHR